VTAITLFGLLGGAPAGGSDGHSPNQTTPRSVTYPQGRALKRAIEKIEAAPLALAAPGEVSWHAGRTYLQAHAVNGGGLQMALRSAATVRVTEDHPGVAPLDSAPSRSLTSIEYDLAYQGVPLAKSSSRSLIVRGDRPIYVRNRNLPANLDRLGSVEPSVDFETAKELGLRDSRAAYTQIYEGQPLRVKSQPGVLIVSSSERAKPRLEIWVDPEDQSPRLAWSYTVQSTDRNRPFERHYWVTAKDQAKILDHEDKIFYEQPLPAVGGTVTGSVWMESSIGPLQGARPLKWLNLSVQVAQGQSFAATTDALGQYHAPGALGQVTVRAGLNGRFCRIVNEQDSFGSGHEFTVTKSGAGVIAVDFKSTDNEEFKIAQVTAYYWVNEAHDFVKEYLPQTPTKLLNVSTHVNIDDRCNAYWSPSDQSLNFFRKGECSNTAYRDIVLHEYGHGVDDELGGILDGAYSEGFGDSLAILYTRDSIVGHDFYGPGKHLRDANEVVQWPIVQGGEVHLAGQAYAGFTWVLTQQLQQKYHNADQAFGVAKKLILGAAAHNPTDIPAAVQWSFFIDAELYPSPGGGKSLHYDQLKTAATSRKLPVPKNPADLTSAFE
jgi:hypothetical protein